MSAELKLHPPLSKKNIIRFLVILIIILSLAAGYFHSLNKTWEKKYNRLENNYVRVRDELGREETQRLIDLSYEKKTH